MPVIVVPNLWRNPMKKLTVFLIVLFCVSISPLLAQVVLKPKFIKLGKVQSGKAYTLKVQITNTSPQTISLWNLSADCDCTKAHIDKAVLKPKSSTKLTIEYHPPLGEDGFKTRVVRFQVYSQDKRSGIQKTMMQFSFAADLHSPFVLDPTDLDGGVVFTGHTKEIHGKLKLDPKVYRGWALGAATSSVPGLNAQVKALPTPGSYDVLVSVPTGLNTGTYQGQVTILGVSSSPASFIYPFHLNVASLWNLSPSYLDLGVLTPQLFRDWKRKIQIREIYRKSFKILKIEGNPDWLNTHQEKNSLGDMILVLEVDGGKLEKAREKRAALGELTIQTDFKDEPAIKIPLKGTWDIPTVTPTPVISTTPYPTRTPTPSMKVKPENKH